MSIVRRIKMGLIELFRKPTLAEIEANRRGQEINHRIDNAICDVKKHKSELKHVLYTSIVHDNISRRLSNVIHTIDDHLDVLKSKKNESFDDTITDNLTDIVNDIQRSM